MAKTRNSQPKLSEVARHLKIPAGIVKSGFPSVQKRAHALGIEFDRWQQGLGTVLLGKRADGQYACGIGGAVISICRQVGKTFTIGVIALILCVLFPGLKILWTAHRTRTSDETFRTMTGLSRRKTLARFVLAVRRANGQQEIEFSNGSRIMFGARELGFGRGFEDVDIEIFDESQILTEKALDDMVPATNTAQNPLLIFLGTPPKPGDPGEVFTDKRSAALAGDTDIFYIEISADVDADVNDRGQWRKANPSYPSRTPESSMLRMLKNLGEDSFKREALGIWSENTSHSAIDITQWQEQAIDQPAEGGVVSRAIDMPPDRSSLAIGRVKKYEDGTAHIELEKFESTQSKGTAWAVDWIVERWPKTAAVVIDSQSPAMALLPDLKKRHVKVIVTNYQEMGRACGRFLDMLRDGNLTHLSEGNQPALDTAVANATTRNIGNSGAVGWNKLGSDIDISPLVAVTLALYGAFITKRHPGRKQQVMI